MFWNNSFGGSEYASTSINFNMGCFEMMEKESGVQAVALGLTLTWDVLKYSTSSKNQKAKSD